MTLKRFALISLMVITPQTFAGQISGVIRSGNTALSGVEVVIECGAVTVSGTTDSSGRYSIFLSATGSCSLKLPTQDASARVFSSNQPTRHDFLLEGNTLRRR